MGFFLLDRRVPLPIESDYRTAAWTITLPLVTEMLGLPLFRRLAPHCINQFFTPLYRFGAICKKPHLLLTHRCLVSVLLLLGRPAWFSTANTSPARRSFIYYGRQEEVMKAEQFGAPQVMRGFPNHRIVSAQAGLF